MRFSRSNDVFGNRRFVFVDEVCVLVDETWFLSMDDEFSSVKFVI